MRDRFGHVARYTRPVTEPPAPPPAPYSNPNPFPADVAKPSDAKALGPAAVLGVVWAILPAVNGTLLLVYANTTGEWLRSHQSNGPVIYAAAFAVLAGLGLLPTYASAILGGWAFGFSAGFPAALVGFAGGALVGYIIAAKTAGDRVENLIESKPQWKAVRDALIGGSWLKVLGIVTLIRIPPNSPFALSNLVLASVRTPLSAYMLGTVIGMAPRTAAVLFVASQVRDQVAADAVSQTPKWFFIAGIALTIVVIAVIGSIAKRVLARVVGGTRTGEQDVGEA